MQKNTQKHTHTHAHTHSLSHTHTHTHTHTHRERERERNRERDRERNRQSCYLKKGAATSCSIRGCASRLRWFQPALLPLPACSSALAVRWWSDLSRKQLLLPPNFQGHLLEQAVQAQHLRGHSMQSGRRPRPATRVFSGRSGLCCLRTPANRHLMGFGRCTLRTPGALRGSVAGASGGVRCFLPLCAA